MAEVIANEIIKAVLRKLAEKAIKEYVRSRGIRSELKNLEKTLSKIQKLLVDAYNKENGDEDVKNWLNNLQHLAYDVDDILDDLETDAMSSQLNDELGEQSSRVRNCIPTCCTNFTLSTEFGPKLDRIAAKLQALEMEKEALGLNANYEKPKSTRIEETSSPEAYVVGREDEKKKLLDKLLRDDEHDQRFSVVPIVGMGGVGKTTLARLLYNETQVTDHFELKAWVCVSDDFDVFKISKSIFQDLAKENKNFENLNQVQMAIIEQLKRGGRCLLVLDDVWSDNYADWEILVRPFHSCAPGSKIILTTRKEELLTQLGFDHLDKLESLSDGDALSLFAYHALGVYNFDSHPTLKTHGERIVKKCGSLPLALKALGRLLRTKKDVQRWREVLNSPIWGLENKMIVPALRLSYHDLPSYLKQLFAYSSLFPKDFLFNKDDLVLLWMAEGFLNESIANKTKERLGHEYFEMLLSRSFFQHAPNVESLYVMHDLMNDLAIFVAGDYFLRFDNQMEIEKEALAKYRHMSFLKELHVSYQRFEPFKKAGNLRTFLGVYVGVKKPWDSFYLSNKIIVDVLPKLHLLRVLNMSSFEIKELPEFIGSMKHLRYLNLSKTKIRELPENVCNLFNLETLILFGCRNLSKLPNSFLKLINLRHFDIIDTPLLTKMPFGISELKNLQTLPKIIMGGDDGFTITELYKMKNLHGKISIEGMEEVKNSSNARGTKLWLNKITELELTWANVFDGSRNEAVEKEVLSELKPHSDNLKKLIINSYGGAEFPNWVGDPSFFQLVFVFISGCRKCTSIQPFAQLPFLKKLYIQGMSEVKVVGFELLGKTGVAFPSLEVLHFHNMLGLEVWSTKYEVVFPHLRDIRISNCPNLIKVSLEALPWLEILTFYEMKGWEVWLNDSGVVFPRLRELCIRGCPNLVEVSLESLPSLRDLHIQNCGDGVLRSIVCASLSVTKLYIEDISGLTNEAWKDVMMYLGTVEKLRVANCNEIRYLWESEAEARKVLVNLRQLVVRECSELVSLGKKNEKGGNLLLTSIAIYKCQSMKHCICGNSIERLEIYDCGSMTHINCGNNIESLSIARCRLLTSVSFPTETGGEEQKQNLKSLCISDCENLLIKELRGDNNTSSNKKRMAMLELVIIEGWRNLKVINELSYSIYLTELYIENCPNLESLPDMEFLNLTSLKYMRIVNCPSMDACFPRGNWPSNLSYLSIGELKKPISKWGNQNFPTSLDKLYLYGKGGDDIDDISQLSEDLIPPSLTELSLVGFEKMERVSKGLQHLTSLQHLWIHRCPEITDLPETLMPFLLSLKINNCPKLKERSNGRSSHYWPLISHIPQIKIDYADL